MSGNHTRARLAWAESEYEANLFSIGANGRWLMSVRHNGEQLVELQRANLRRLVACWNSCAGIPSESLEANGVASMADSASLVREVAELRAERDALQSQLDAMGKGEPVASIYISAMGREFDDWKCELPEGRNLLFTAPKALAPHEDTKLLDYLQARQATVEILMDGHGLSTPLFRIGGLHGTICADIRGAIGAAIESLKEPTP